MIDKVLGLEPVARRRKADNASETYFSLYAVHPSRKLALPLQFPLLGLISES